MQPTYRNLAGGRQEPRRTTRACGLLCTALLSVSALAQTEITAVEYYRSDTNQYFLTGRATEQALLDGVTDFKRTGMTFVALPASKATISSRDSVCRYRIEVAPTQASTHFYGLADDCALIAQSNLPNFFNEGVDFAVTKRIADGMCPTDAPVTVLRAFRAQSKIALANHRYFTNRATYDATVRQGWTPEGAVFCAGAGTDEMLSATPSAPKLLTGGVLPMLPRLKNQSATANTFEANLTASAVSIQVTGGTPTDFWGYNGSVPGPTIDVYEGDTVRIRFDNRLPQPSTIHWHGLPVPASQDGNPMDPVAAGSARIYEFTLPLGSAGTYWYHPHAHGVTAEQVYRGLAGAFIVRPRSDSLPAALREQLLLMSDLKLAVDGSIAPNSQIDNTNGREGQYLLVNGALRPALDIRPGEVQRWKLFNATNARYIRFAIDGQRFTQIGTDGGLLATPLVDRSELLLAPGERAEIVVAASILAGITTSIRAKAYDRGSMGMSATPTDVVLGSLNVTTDDAVARTILPAALRTIAPLLAAGVTAQTTRRFVLSERGGMAMGGAGSFLINGKSFDMNRVDSTVRLGTVERWDVENTSTMDHPFHLHGTQFQVISRSSNGVPATETFIAWRDTVNVPPNTSVSFLVRQDSLGKRMYHCHILEHEDQGMMGILDVIQ